MTVSNIGIWMAALCHLSGVILSTRLKRTIRPAGIWLGAVYTLALGVVMLVTMATLKGWLPVFFVDGQGGTMVRYIVLSSSLVMFTLTAVLLWESNRPSLSSFTYWYTLALLLIAVGVFGMIIELTRNSLLDWICRVSQYLSGIYMLIAAIASIRESEAREITMVQSHQQATLSIRFGHHCRHCVHCCEIGVFADAGNKRPIPDFLSGCDGCSPLWRLVDRIIGNRPFRAIG